MATNSEHGSPRAVIHKRILDSAAARPDASVAELAADLAGASPDLVERVLDEYGDPGVDESTGEDELPQAAGPDGGPLADESDPDEPMTDEEPVPMATELTDKQREALSVVAEHPDATQAELADLLGVSRATVNKRVNAVEGFEWTERQAFVERLFAEAEPAPDEGADDGAADSSIGADDEAVNDRDQAAAASRSADSAPVPGTPPAAASDGGRLLDPDEAQTLEQLQERVARLEQRMDETLGDGTGAREDTAVLAKAMRAVLGDESITEDEELRVLEALL